MIGRRLALGALVVVVAMAAGCSAGAPILANPPAQRPSAPVPTPPPVAIADPIVVELPG
ncbi:MAG: OmpA family protein, partial [Chloroflexi bacterium]|nr:OmpA family protein [Chloroflexota bacterium]